MKYPVLFFQLYFVSYFILDTKFLERAEDTAAAGVAGVAGVMIHNNVKAPNYWRLD
jgi:hypothetical protein